MHLFKDTLQYACLLPNKTRTPTETAKYVLTIRSLTFYYCLYLKYSTHLNRRPRVKGRGKEGGRERRMQVRRAYRIGYLHHIESVGN